MHQRECIVGAAGENAHFAAAFARIECHYFINKVRLCLQRKKSPVVALRLCMPRRSSVSRGAATPIGEVRCGQGFFSTDEWILENAHRIKHIPTIIVQGRQRGLVAFEPVESVLRECSVESCAAYTRFIHDYSGLSGGCSAAVEGTTWSVQ